jgi:hypothetical protein
MLIIGEEKGHDSWKDILINLFGFNIFLNLIKIKIL